MELKMLNNPPSSVHDCVVTTADFVTGEPGKTTFASAKGKLYEYVRKGVGSKDVPVTQE